MFRVAGQIELDAHPIPPVSSKKCVFSNIDQCEVDPQRCNITVEECRPTSGREIMYCYMARQPLPNKTEKVLQVSVNWLRFVLFSKIGTVMNVLEKLLKF